MRLPNDSQRYLGLGKTGSGKSQAGLWQLSERSYTEIPWTIVDFKQDKLIAQIPYTTELQLNEFPEGPGLYVIRPLPDDSEALDEYLMKVWHSENHGLFIDEGYMIGNGKGDSRAFRAVLTQGRSKRIPMITLSQRPAWLSRFAFSEADFFQVFWLNDVEDRKRVADFLPLSKEQRERRLPLYHSTYYDVSDDELLLLKPVPDFGTVLATFERRLAPTEAAKKQKPLKIAI